MSSSTTVPNTHGGHSQPLPDSDQVAQRSLRQLAPAPPNPNSLEHRWIPTTRTFGNPLRVSQAQLAYFRGHGMPEEFPFPTDAKLDELVTSLIKRLQAGEERRDNGRPVSSSREVERAWNNAVSEAQTLAEQIYYKRLAMDFGRDIDRLNIEIIQLRSLKGELERKAKETDAAKKRPERALKTKVEDLRKNTEMLTKEIEELNKDRDVSEGKWRKRVLEDAMFNNKRYDSLLEKYNNLHTAYVALQSSLENAERSER